MKPFINYGFNIDVELEERTTDQSIPVMVHTINSDDVFFFEHNSVSKNMSNNQLKVVNVDEHFVFDAPAVMKIYKTFK